MERLLQKLRAGVFLLALAMLVVGFLRAWKKIEMWEIGALAGGGLLLGLVLRGGGGARRELPAPKPTPKSGA